MGHSQENSFPTPGDLPSPGIKPVSLASPALADGFFTISTTWEAPLWITEDTKNSNMEFPSCC